MKQTRMIDSVKVVGLSLIIMAGFYYVSAWSGPSAPAPNGNVLAPINTSTSSQEKIGPFFVDGNFGTFGTVTAPQYCIGSSCITSWPSSGTSLSSVGSCPTNYYLQGFDSSGNKICKFVYQIAGATENSGRGAYAYPSNLAFATCPPGFYAHQVLGYPDLDGSLFLCLNY